MSTMTIPAPPLTDAIADTFFRISVDRYLQMVDVGILTEDDAVELLDGWIVKKMSRNRKHIVVTNLLGRALEPLLSDAHHVEIESVLTLATSVPEPDLMLVRGHLLDYPDHPTGNDVALLVEVADSSLRRDQNQKKQLYAAAQIPVYWVVNLTQRQIEVHGEPSGDGDDPNYYHLQTFRGDDEVPVVVDGKEIGRIPVHTLFPS